MTDRKGNIITINAAFSNLTGYYSDDVYGKSIAKLLKGPLTDATLVDKMESSLKKSSTPF